MRWFILLLLPTALLAEDLLLASWNIRIFSTGSRADAASLAVSDHRPIWATFDMDGPDDMGTRRRRW